MNIVNLTPHVLNIQDADNKIVNVEPSGTITRVSTSRKQFGEVAGIPVFQTVFGEITDLPEPQDNTIYVVSALVQARTSREDVYAPGELIRNDEGQVIGCHGLTANTPSLVFDLTFTEGYDAKFAEKDLSELGFKVENLTPEGAPQTLRFTR